MDIHLDRWLENVPMPPEMPDGHAVSYLAMFGSDLSRLSWGAWGDPRGFVPKMANYFKLCNMVKSDEAIIDQIGGELQPQLVGSWIGVSAGKVVTGWHILEPKPWSQVEPMFGSHAAKEQVTQWVKNTGVARIERFTQSIGDGVYSEIEFALPGDSVEAQVTQLDDAFEHFTGARLAPTFLTRLREVLHPGFAISVRIKGGQVVKLGAIIPGMPSADIAAFCAAAGVKFDEKVLKVTGALAGDGVSRLEYARAGAYAGVDLFVEPGEVVKADPKKAAAN